jgi:hypothetical protein
MSNGVALGMNNGMGLDKALGIAVGVSDGMVLCVVDSISVRIALGFAVGLNDGTALSMAEHRWPLRRVRCRALATSRGQSYSVTVSGLLLVTLLDLATAT